MNEIDIDESNDFGFSTYDEDELLADSDDRAQRIYGLVMPLLRNLLEGAEKPIIKWPNRREALTALINDLDDIMGKENEVELFE